MLFSKFSITTISFILISSLSPQYSFAQKDWTLKKDKNGIKVYTKDHESGNVKYYRLITSFKAEIEEVVNLNIDFANYENWVKDCEKSEIIKTDNNSIIYYSKFNAPWPASDRDFVSEVTVQRLTNEVIFYTKPSQMDYPIEKGVVRVTNYQDSWRVQKLEDNMIKLELEGYYDPGGSVPAWIVNMFIVDAPYESILLLKNKTEITN